MSHVLLIAVLMRQITKLSIFGKQAWQQNCWQEEHLVLDKQVFMLDSICPSEVGREV